MIPTLSQLSFLWKKSIVKSSSFTFSLGVRETIVENNPNRLYLLINIVNNSAQYSLFPVGPGGASPLVVDTSASQITEKEFYVDKHGKLTQVQWDIVDLLNNGVANIFEVIWAG